MMEASPTSKPARKLWLRRLFYAGALLIWLAVMLLPLFGAILAVRGELSWERGLAHDRVFLVQNPEQRGIGWEAARRHSSPNAGQIYVRTTVRYFLWEGNSAGLNTQFVECYSQRPGGDYEYIGACQAP